MKRIGIIDDERLRHVPKNRRGQHEYCFHIHDLMVQLLTEVELLQVGHVELHLDGEDEMRQLAESEHALDFLAATGRGEIERRVVINHMSVALFSDMLHFIFGALTALERRKFAVAFSLLRKPFKEGLLTAAWMCADEQDFFNRLKSDPRDSFDQGRLSPDQKKAVIQGAIDKCRGTSFADADRIYALVYDRKNEFGLAPLFDKATHLFTRNIHIATEDYNVNFIFKNPLDVDLYDGYVDIAIILLFLHMMQIELCSRMDHYNKKYLNWLLFTSLGAYEALFVSGRSGMLLGANRMFKEFLNCPRCDEPIRVRKVDAPRFFITEMLQCRSCGAVHSFPLSWLLSNLEVDIA